MSFVILYSSSIKLLNEINNLMESRISLQNNFLIDSKLQELSGLIDQLLNALRRETSSSKKQSQKEKLEALKNDYSACLSRLNLLKQELSQQHMKDREELLSHKNVINRNTTTILDLNGYDASHVPRLDTAASSVDDYITLGRQSLDELISQRDLLKSTQRRVLDAANKLGLSHSVIRFIEQRSLTDKYLLYGGLIFCVGLMYLVIVYLG